MNPWMLTLVAVTTIAVGAAMLRAVRSSRGRHTVEPNAGLDPTDLMTDAEPTEQQQSIPTLTAALDALSLAVVVADADEVLTFQNRSAEEILNAYDGRALITQAMRGLLVEAVRGEATEREVELFGPPSKTYLIRAVPLLAGDEDSPGGQRHSGGVAVIEDITERRRLDQIRRDFVSNIGHELKTPVGAVGLLAEMLRDEEDLETVRRFSGRIADEVNRLSHTIDDLLALSRIEFADDLSKHTVVIGVVIDDVVGLYRNAAQARDISIRVTGTTNHVVSVDRRQISSAVGNLIDNAVKYSMDGSSVVVDLANDPGIAGESADQWLVISVIDQGVGIPSSDIDRVFERFYRVDQARSRETGGTGLGLAIVRHVAHNHGGDVSVRSREGQGSEFSLRIPIAGFSDAGEVTS